LRTTQVIPVAVLNERRASAKREGQHDDHCQGNQPEAEHHAEASWAEVTAFILRMYDAPPLR
jgi:hypothetical protein